VKKILGLALGLSLLGGSVVYAKADDSPAPGKKSSKKKGKKKKGQSAPKQ
jgi:hypothetical protein